MSRAALSLKIPDHISTLIRSLHPELKKKIRLGLDWIVDDPERGKALKEGLVGLHSLRVGHFRVIYRIQNKVIEIVAIGPRKNVYLDTYRLIKKEFS